ncbi:hypothetical protein HDG33_000154 [Paraburkholderia sp. Cpub6]|nr:hypothetical protein [Paraburkholderia sp. Cpub6]
MAELWEVAAWAAALSNLWPPSATGRYGEIKGDSPAVRDCPFMAEPGPIAELRTACRPAANDRRKSTPIRPVGTGAAKRPLLSAQPTLERH